jgi:hypothetical protein
MKYLNKPKEGEASVGSRKGGWMDGRMKLEQTTSLRLHLICRYHGLSLGYVF